MQVVGLTLAPFQKDVPLTDGSDTRTPELAHPNSVTVATTNLHHSAHPRLHKTTKTPCGAIISKR